MNKEIWFLTYRFTFLQFLCLCLGWSFFLCFIWPLIIGSYFFVSFAVCLGALLLTGLVNNRLFIGLLVLFHFSKRAVIYYQNVMLVLCTLLCTWIFSWFVRMEGYIFADHFMVNAFSVFLYYKLVMSGDNGS